MSKLLKCWETKCQWSTSMYDKMNSYQKAAFRVEEAVSQLYLATLHSSSPTVSDYYYGNPLAYACKTAVRDTES